MKAPLELIHPKLIKSCRIPNDKSQAPACITLREWQPGKEWVTHYCNLQNGGYYYGRYFSSLEGAERDFKQRVLEYGGKL